MWVFLVQHTHDLENEEDVKIIGIYSTREKAEQAIERLRSQAGFKDCPNSFYIDRYKVDEDHWKEGYVTV